METERKENIPVISGKNVDFTSFLEKDGTFLFVYKKTEKISAAIYLITNFFSDTEPMKWALRQRTTDLLSFIVTYKNESDMERVEFINNAKNKILELVSFLEIASLATLMSTMNFSILRDEFLHVLKTIETFLNIQTDTTNKYLLPKSFFDLSRANTSDRHTVPVTSGYAVGQGVPHSYSGIKDTSLLKDNTVFKRSNRQNIILGLFKKKNELTIKDIAQVIKDCSEKTIQRELISFIGAGVLKKTGERRWSKYSLVS
jgi:hypothetical protein